MTPNLARYERIAPFYDVLDLPFERRRYTRITHSLAEPRPASRAR
jgi:hypothetical protein